jgi:hypothetical protein
MPWSNSVSRRYTPPTCTLEITAKGSPLSQWSDRPVWKNVRFQLHFDDPRLSSEQQITIRGSQTQLEALGETVDHYVQQCLLATAGSPSWTPYRLREEPVEFDDPGQFHQPEPATISGTLIPPALGSQVQSEPESRFGSAPTPDSPAALGITLQPRGLTNHYLSLGRLATEISGPGIVLSTLQLFDLATALDEYRTEGLAIPTLNQPQWYKRPVVWGRIAAGVLLALGLTPHLASVWEGAGPVMQSEVPTSSESATSTDQQQQIAARVEPLPKVESAPIDPFALQSLPPPPPDGAVQPGAPAAELPTVPVAPTPAAPQVPSGAQGTLNQAAPQVPPQPAPVPRSDTVVTLPRVAPGEGSQPQLDITPQEARPGIAADVSPQDEVAIAESPESAASTFSGDAARSAAPAAPSAGTAFDTVPQVAEARQYFQNRWTPPESLSQTLEYRLVVNANGSIQEVVPLGQASATYLDRTNMPLRDEAFVSAPEGGRTLEMRLVLSPDGGVRTFLEATR